MVSAPGHHAGKLTVAVVVVRVRGPSHPPYTGARQKLPPGGLRTALAVDTTHPLALTSFETTSRHLAVACVGDGADNDLEA